MILRALLLFTVSLLLFSCSSTEEEVEKPEEEKTEDQINAEWQKKSDEWLKERKRVLKQQQSQNQLTLSGTRPQVKVDMEKVKAVRENAVKGDPEYQYSLGMCYKYGYGMKADNDKALYWFKKAADQGHKQAERVYRFMLHRK